MFYIPQHYVKIAIDRLGGVTKTANAMAVSATTILKWRKAHRVANIDKAKLLAKLTGLEITNLRPTL